jgi:5-methyltetrahydropteroyltriglutamate--homocysteine methyltransferase
MINNIETSVIGSYPVTIDRVDLIKKYFENKPISWDNNIISAVNDMKNAGLDYISDGQTRDSFIQIFTRKLNGCRIRSRSEVIGKIEYENPITLNDLKLIRNLLINKKIIGVLTGPFTLAKSCINMFYEDEKELCFDFAFALNKEARNIQDIVDMISIDEPFFSNELPDYATDLLKIVTKDISCITRLHCCGDVSKIVPDLLDFPVDILSNEFKAKPKLFEVFKEHSITKNICLGSVRSDNIKIESVDDILIHVRKGLEYFGDRIIQISPDCGLKMLPRHIAYEKIQNLVKVGDLINA